MLAAPISLFAMLFAMLYAVRHVRHADAPLTPPLSRNDWPP
jgi:hypothetical protein